MTMQFKATKKIEIKHERGVEIQNQVCGTVIKIDGDRVYLKGEMYDFNISKSNFEKFNKFKSN
jgi:hypothetical protein